MSLVREHGRDVNEGWIPFRPPASAPSPLYKLYSFGTYLLATTVPACNDIVALKTKKKL